MNPAASGPGDAARVADDGVLHIGGLRVTCQRCLAPEAGFHPSPPRSLGMLPLGRDAHGEFLVPLACDEAFWLGLTITTAPGAARRLLIAAETRARGTLNVFSGRALAEDGVSCFVVSGHAAVQGIFRDARSWWPFQDLPTAAVLPGGCRRLRLSAGPAALVVLRLVAYGEFREETGLPAPAPLDPGAGYGGWLLP